MYLKSTLISITKTTQLMHLMEVIIVYCENLMRPVSTACRQNAGSFLNVRRAVYIVKTGL